MAQTMQFKIVDCHTNDVYNIRARNYDSALRRIYAILGHLCVAFV